MTHTDQIAMGLGIAFLAIAVVIFLFRLHRVRQGADGQKKRVSGLLRRFAKPRDYQVLDDVKLVDGALSGWAHHILVGRFGVLLVYDVSVQGEYHGKHDDERWSILARDGKRWSVENPLFEADKCEGRVRTLLKEKAGIRVPVEKTVVIACPMKGSVSTIRSQNVMLLKQFRAYLRKDKFEEDHGIDPEKVCKILSEANC